MIAAIITILLIIAGGYLALCVDAVTPVEWNFALRFAGMPFRSMPTTNGYLLGLLVSALILLISARLH